MVFWLKSRLAQRIQMDHYKEFRTLCPHDFVQCHFLACTDAHSYISVSYYPENKTGNFFLLHRDNILIDIFMEVCNSTYENLLKGWVTNQKVIFYTLIKLKKKKDFALKIKS